MFDIASDITSFSRRLDAIAITLSPFVFGALIFASLAMGGR